MLSSWLYVPGTRTDRVPKALATGAGAVLLDLEETVADGDKGEARRQVEGVLATTPACGSTTTPGSGSTWMP